MNLNRLLLDKGIDPQRVLVLRHRPHEPELNKVLPWLAAEKPDVFNAYQQTQKERVELEMMRADYVASFIGREAGKAPFVGLYSVEGSKPITRREFWRIPAYIELKDFGAKGFMEEESRSSVLWFDLALRTDFYAHWKGKLIVRWPPLDRNWHRWAHKPKNDMPIHAILEQSALDAAMPDWDKLDLKWEELGVLTTRWKSKLSEWRGIYCIFDRSNGKGYVGAAYGDNNLLSRWQNYAARGDGGNRLLRPCDPKHFQFTILQRVSPDMDKNDVIALENTWKERLHTRQPFGLNCN